MGDVLAGVGGLVGTVLLLLGLTLATIGLYGLLRKPDIFHQLHPASLITGPAVLLVLLASVGYRSAEIMTSAVLVIGFRADYVVTVEPCDRAGGAPSRAEPDDDRSGRRLGGLHPAVDRAQASKPIGRDLVSPVRRHRLLECSLLAHEASLAVGRATRTEAETR